MSLQVYYSEWGRGLGSCLSRIAVGIGIGGTAILCVEAQNSAVGQVYHNTTAHYNALFIARAQHTAIKEALREQENPSYEEILPVYLEYDSTQMQPLAEQIEDCIKKSSLVLQYHPTSKWSDEAYLLLGQARHYHDEKNEAIKAFQYLSRKGKGEKMRMAAKIALLRMYVQDSLLREAQQAATYIAKSPPRARENQLHYLLGIAYLAQKLGRIEDALRYIHHALPLARGNKYLQTRLHFILGQSYEALNEDAVAHTHYQQCAKRLLPYDFYLEARLRAWACTPIRTVKSLKKVRKGFNKQLHEQKNKELRYKIHFHWARMEQKQGHESATQQQYIASAALNEENALLQGRAYEQLAIMYYKEEKVLLAASYYEKAAESLPEAARGYAALQRRSEIFQRLAQHYETQQREDSLLRISELPQEALLALVKAEQAKELARRAQEKKAKAAKEAADQARNYPDRPYSGPVSATPSSGGSWYFYNQVQVSKGRKLFEKQWGRRILADNWRSSQRSLSKSSQSSKKTQAEASALTDKATALPGETEDKAAISIESLIAHVPQDKKSKAAAQERLEKAYYGLGNIYYFELEEKRKGIHTFMELIRRFPSSLYRARLLYLLAKDDTLSIQQRAQFASTLRKDYADSIYTTLLDRPNYLVEQAAAVRELQKHYKEAYTVYKQGNYEATRRILRSAMQAQEETNSFTENAILLDIILEAKLGLEHMYQYRLKGFVRNFPKSELLASAKDLLKGAEEIQKRRKYSSIPQYALQKREAHSLLWACFQQDMADSLRIWLPQVLPLPAAPEVILLDTELWLLFVPHFTDASSAIRLLAAYTESHVPAKIAEKFPEIEIQALIVGQSNLSMLFESKDIDSYQAFFQQHYAF